ncbi:MAG: hypothetical protein RJB66_2220 [Pseudomonadota bacterium]|jgi:dephospho-CoA kinase
MKWIGLTGSIGAGKSTVANALRKAGYHVIDADAIAHESLKKGTTTYDLIVKKIGPTIVEQNGDIDRRALGRVVFGNSSEKSWLEGVIHPHVQARVRELRTELEQKGEFMAFYEVPLLFEKGLQSQFDKVVVVWVSPDVQQERLQKRNAWSAEEISQRNQAQWPIAEKLKQADFAINNDGSLADLEKQIDHVIKQLKP